MHQICPVNRFSTVQASLGEIPETNENGRKQLTCNICQ